MDVDVDVDVRCLTFYNLALGVVAEPVDRGLLVQEIGNLVPHRVKSLTYQIDARHFLAWRSALIV